MAEQIDLAIVGGGPAGLAAGLVAHGNDLATVVFEASGTIGGQLLRADHPITDLLGRYADTGPELVGVFAEQVARAGLEVRLGARVDRIEQRDGRFTLAIGEQLLHATAVLVATGVRPRRLNVPGETDLHVDARAREAAPSLSGKRVVVIGGGDEASSNAIVLAQYGALVTMLVRGPALGARPLFAEWLAATPAIRVITGANVAAIEPDAVVTTDQRRILADRVFVKIGAVASWPAMLPEPAVSGGIITAQPSGSTNVAGLLAAGDLVSPPSRRYVAIASGLGVAAARAVEQLLRGR